MAYDTYGRPLRGNGEPGYFGTHDSIPDYNNYYPSEPRDSDPASRRRDWDNWEHTRNRRSPNFSDSKMASGSEYAEDVGIDGISPEKIAALTAQITEKVTRERKLCFCIIV
jgi:hypothetical protein